MSMSFDLGSAHGKITLDTSGVDSSIKSINASLAGFQGFGKVAFLGVGAAAAAGFGLAVKSAVDMNSSLETSTLQFETLMGDADKAREHVKALFDFAGKTPFETGPIIEASRMLETFGGAALNSMDNLTLIGDASAAVSAPINELGFWVGRLYSNLQAGKPFGEAAMRLSELAVLSPKAREEMEELQASGASASDIFGVFQDSLGKFSGAMEKQAGTWSGLMSTLKDSLGLMAAEGLKPLFDLLKDGLGGLVEYLSSPGVKEGITAFAENMRAAIEQVAAFISEHGDQLKTVLGALAAGFGALVVISQVVGWVTSLAGAVAGMGAAFTAAGGGVAGVIALLGGPVTLVLAAVAGAVALVAAAWRNNWGGIQEKTKAAVDYIRGVIGKGMAFIRGVWEQHGEGILAHFRRVWDTISTIFGTVFANLRDTFLSFKAFFTGDWEKLGQLTRDIWDRSWRAVVGVLQNLWDSIRPALQAMWTRLSDWWDGIDWAELGQRIITGIVEGLAGIGPAIVDALKKGKEAATDFLKGLGDGSQEAEQALGGVAEAARETARVLDPALLGSTAAARGLGYVADAADDGSESFDALTHYAETSGYALDGTSEAAVNYHTRMAAAVAQTNAAGEAARLAAERVAALTAAFNGVSSDYFNELPGADDPLVAPEADLSFTTGGLAEDDVARLEKYQEIAAGLVEDIDNLTHGIGTFGMTQDEVNEKLAEAYAELGHYQGLMAPLQGVIGETSTVHRDLAVNMDAVNAKMLAQLQTAGAAPEAIIAFATATGQMTEEQGRAALAAALVAVKIEELAKKVKGGLPIETAMLQLQGFVRYINGEALPAAGNVPAAIQDIKDEMYEAAEGIGTDAPRIGEAITTGLAETVTTGKQKVIDAAKGMAADAYKAAAGELGAAEGSSSTAFQSIGDGVVQGFIDGVAGRGEEPATAAGDMAQAAIDKAEELLEIEPPSAVFTAIGDNVVQGFIDGVNERQESAASVIRDLALYIVKTAELGLDLAIFRGIGMKIVDALAGGIRANAGAVDAALRDVIQAAIAAALGAVGGNGNGNGGKGSGKGPNDGGAQMMGAAFAGGLGRALMNPFEDFGKRLSEGLQEALRDALREAIREAKDDEALEALENWMMDGIRRVADAIAGIGRGADSWYVRTVIDPLKESIGQLDELLGDQNDAIRQQEKFMRGLEWGNSKNAQAWFTGLADAPTETAIARLQHLMRDSSTLMPQHVQVQAQKMLDMLRERQRLEKEQEAQQHKLMQLEERRLAMEERRAEMAYLQTQMDLVKLIKENDLDEGILAGLKLGLDADAGGIIDAMIKAMEQLIDAAEGELKISSPSKVFRDMGENMMNAMALGISSADAVEQSIRARMKAAAVAGQPALSPRPAPAAAGQQVNHIYGGYHVTATRPTTEPLRELYEMGR